jgi:hypothetical protein
VVQRGKKMCNKKGISGTIRDDFCIGGVLDRYTFHLVFPCDSFQSTKAQHLKYLH